MPKRSRKAVMIVEDDPRRRRDLYEVQSAALDELGISKTDRERILGGNTVALLEG